METLTPRLAQRQVAIIAWDGMNLTDFTSSIEVLSHARNEAKDRLYKTTVVADSDLSTTSAGIVIKRDLNTELFLQNVENYDILVLPGGGAFTAENFPQPAGLLKSLEAFKQLDGKGGQRVIMSICAGSFFLAAASLLKGKVATAHPFSLPELRKLCDKHGGSTVVRQHYVDAGLSDNGIGLIVSGGITSGFDAALYLVEKEQGYPMSERVRAVMDAEYRREALPYGIY